MNEQDAISVAKKLGPSIGETIFFTSESDIIHHPPACARPLGPWPYAVRKNWMRQLEFAKVHDDDDVRDVEPRFRSIYYTKEAEVV